MVLKCPKCGLNTVTLVDYKVRNMGAVRVSAQYGTLKCSNCDYKEVFGGAF